MFSWLWLWSVWRGILLSRSLSPCFSLVHIVATVRDLFLHRHTRSRILAHTHTLNESLVITNRCYNHSILERVSVRQSQTRKKNIPKNGWSIESFQLIFSTIEDGKNIPKTGSSSTPTTIFIVINQLKYIMRTLKVFLCPYIRMPRYISHPCLRRI